MIVHNFKDSLRRSHEYTDAPWWRDVYEKAFPGLRAMVDVRQDGWAQRAGIDRVLTLKSGLTVTVDEKVREKAWGDFCLEYWSDEKRKIRGWVAKDLACNYIAYAFAPICTCYLLDTLSLRAAWRKNRLRWVGNKDYPEIRADNGNYTTVSVGVPIDVVLAAMGNAMTIRWTSND